MLPFTVTRSAIIQEVSISVVPRDTKLVFLGGFYDLLIADNTVDGPDSALESP